MSTMISLTRRCSYLFTGSLLLEKTVTSAQHEFITLLASRNICTTMHMYDTKQSKGAYLMPYDFEEIEKREKDTYIEVVRNYVKYNANRRGHVEFIKAALKNMEHFGVQHDLEVYKSILDVFPKGGMIPTNKYQAMLTHYPLQQEVACQLFDQMDTYKVCPDSEMWEMIKNIFGRESGVARRYRRQIYWTPKFRNLNPWFVERPVPTDSRVLSDLAIHKISSVDVQSRVVEYRTKDDVESVEDTWIMSSMSRTQKDLLKRQPLDKPVYVEGPFKVWIVDKPVDYFVLRGDPRPRKTKIVDLFDLSDFEIEFWNKKRVPRPITVHEQADGVYFAMCATGTSTKASLLSWIRLLEKDNPILKHVPVVFKLKSSTSRTEQIEDGLEETKEISDENSENGAQQTRMEGSGSPT